MTLHRTLITASLVVSVMALAFSGSMTHHAGATTGHAFSVRGLAVDPSAWLPDVQTYMLAVWYAGEDAARAEEARAAQERAEAEKSPKMAGPTPVGSTSATASAASGDCANPIVPEAVARRESGCNWQAVNPGGCGGRGCVGLYQLDLGHFAAVSPWNPNVSGVCYGLGDWHDPAVQTACASRLGPGAWG